MRCRFTEEAITVDGDKEMLGFNKACLLFQGRPTWFVFGQFATSNSVNGGRASGSVITSIRLGRSASRAACKAAA